MGEIMISVSHSPMGMYAAVLMGLIILSFFLWYGFFVLTLPSISIISAIKIMFAHRLLREERTISFSPHLGYTMTDGGEPVREGEDKKNTTAHHSL